MEKTNEKGSANAGPLTVRCFCKNYMSSLAPG